MFFSRIVDEKKEVFEIIVHVQKNYRLIVLPQLFQGDDLGGLLQSPPPPGQDDKGVRHVAHHAFAFFHVRGHDQTVQALGGPSLVHDALGNHSRHPASRLFHRIRYFPHQSTICSPVKQIPTVSHKQSSQFFRNFEIAFVDFRRRAKYTHVHINSFLLLTPTKVKKKIPKQKKACIAVTVLHAEKLLLTLKI